ncbi:1-aminocyclopropane-1-carboxylate synthase C [Thozetella sp. PMI_491]|nr:1-aminocyclopropane-1-carboxylate synthase C [Thozetella sp. PMI_491]
MADNVDNLSVRGRGYSDPSCKPPMLDVVCDLWEPQSNPGGYLSLGVAENTLMHAELVDYMTKSFNINSHSLTYGDGFSGSHHLRGLVAKFMNRYFNPVRPVLKEYVAITSGVGPAIEACTFALCDPGDGILLGRPYYGGFPEDVCSRAGAQLVEVSFDGVDPFGIEALDAYEKALNNARDRSILVRALILCNPHNPLGRCYTTEVLEAYLRFCQKHNIHLISDEIYALSVWKNEDFPNAPGFTSILSLETDGIIDPSLVHVLWGMSKDFGSNGIRLGCIISQANKPFLQALETNSYQSCPSALADRVASAILSDSTFIEQFIETNQSRLAENYHIAIRFLESHHIPYVKESNAGFFIWADLFAPLRVNRDSGAPESELWVLERDLNKALLRNKVFLASGAAFGSDVPGWFRIVFAHQKIYLDEGLKRIVQTVEAYRRSLGAKDSEKKAGGEGSGSDRKQLRLSKL